LEDCVTDFVETAMRKFCRNPKCRMKLPAPTSKEREAFCTKGCYQSFYLHRCRVCEVALAKSEGKGRPRLVCKKAKCKNAWAAGEGFGKYAESAQSYPVSQNPEKSAESATNTGRFEPVKAGPRWRIVAGGPLTPSQMHCATVPDGPDCQWKGGSFERIEAQNRKELAAAERAEIEANGYFTEPDWREVVSPDGVLCYVTRFRPATAKGSSPKLRIPDDLSIPSFLLRQPPQQFAEAA
jgi:hypothetical protein